MIAFEYININKFIEKYKTTTPKDAQIKNFKKYYLSYIEERDKQEREGYQKNEINNLLKNTFGYKINEKDNIDSAIYDDNIVKVIIEAKQLKNKNEFPKDDNNPLSKAFYESILYFLREYNQNNNNEIKHIIICNPIDFFVFCADEFRVFIEDKTIKRYYNNCDNKEGVDKSTSKFYKDLESHLKNNFDKTIKYTHFKLTKDIDDLLLSRIYQILSPEILLKKNKIIDANTLHKKFYDELLYILGLQEIKENGKILIKLSNTQNSLSNSIKNAFPNISDEDVFSLIILWNNRILFLRLLESMLISCGHIKEPFLDIEKINNFSTLSRLFFGVLAKKENDRNIDDKKLFHYIPYLNSSLFDKTKLELNGNDIKHLESYTIPLYQKSVLEGKELPLLEYIFRFLHTYDFTTTPKDIKDNIKINHDKLINSSILGLVFEKLNGYKEGSFYTPSFITSYMCKESITQAVLNKFNDTYNWNARGLKDISNLARENNKSQKELLQTLLSLKICDPSVGSGHFLVSALNEIVLIAYKIGLLESFNLKTTLRLENDEIIIKQDEDIFNYQKPNNKDEIQHKIQKELFHLKKEIIESCLFGVDINPNSCEITKLRLWIELLKYSYYIFENDNNTNTLQTLPNIDINIKCGNSLISRFDLKDSLKYIPNINHQIAEYQKLVSSYKNADQSTLNTSKQDIEAQIEKIKQTFTLTLKDPKTKQELEKAIEMHIKNYGISLLDNTSLLDGYPIGSIMFGNPQLSKEQENEAYISYGKIMALRKKLDSFTSGERYKNAFEWRFEFPEVLDKSGDFKGFDCVIGNPPYIDYRNIANQTKTFLKKNSFIYNISATGSIFTYFIEKAQKLINKNGYINFINPINYICQDSGEGLRQFIDNNLTLISMIDISNVKVFNNASTYTCINYFQNRNDATKEIRFSRVRNENQLNNIEFKTIPRVSIGDLSIYLDSITFKIFSASYPKLAQFCDIFCGLSVAGFRADITTKKIPNSVPFVESSDIFRYSLNQVKFLKKYKEYYTSEKMRVFKGDKIIFMSRMTSIIRCCIAPKGYFGGKVNCLYNFSVNYKFILAILNSKLINYFYSKKYFASHMQGGAFGFDTESVSNLPIPKIDSTNKALSDEIISLVEKILDSKAKDPTKDTKELESKIDFLVYKLYNLTKDEIKIIENKE